MLTLTQSVIKYYQVITMKKEIFDIIGMSCSACSAAVGRAMDKLTGVEKADVNLLTNSMSVIYDEGTISADDIIETVKNAGYDARIQVKDATVGKQNLLDKSSQRILVRLTLSAVFLILLMFVAMGHMIGVNLFSHDQMLEKGIAEIVLLLPILILNHKYFFSGFKSLLKLNPNMDSLIAVGATASVIYSLWQMINGGASHYYFESAGMILTFITIGKYLESRSKAKTTSAVTKLIDLSPKKSIIIVDGEEKEIDSKEIAYGDIVVVKAGMTFPADGVVVEGNGSADESAITGESMPVKKNVNSKVTGGTVLLTGYVKFKAEKIGEQTTLAGIIRLVEEATLTKPKIAKFADKISRIFVPCVIAISVLTTVLWFVFSKDFELSLNFGISVLVISCPCALGLATPTAIMVGTGKAAELGILVKSAEVFEAGAKIKTVMFDKTGTVTKGKPKVTDLITEETDISTLTDICVAIESMSDHPLAQAITAYKELNADIQILNFESITGKGVTAVVENDTYRIGNRSLVSDCTIRNKYKEAEFKLAAQGKTPLFISRNDDVIAVLGVADTVKETSSDAIEMLTKTNINTIMLTGDNKETAKAIKEQLKISKAYAELMPADKNEYIRQYQLEGATAMVGDGINDSPALAAADVGIALGAGTDIAMESADVVLVRNDLRDVHTTLYICRKVMRNIKENLFWALIYNTVCIPIAAGALYNLAGIMLSPMIGTVAMSLSSICVISNALRLKTIKREYDTNIRKEMQKMKTVYIEGMMCGHCQARVQQLLEPIDANVVVDFTKGTATIADDADNNAIITAVTSGGYKVINIE